MTELAETWRLVLDPQTDGWNAWFLEQKPRRRKHRMRERRKLESRYEYVLVWGKPRAERGVVANKET